MKTHYEILGIPTYATPAEIQAAYDKRVTPNVGKRRPGKVHDAYNTLIDPVARKMYDAIINAPEAPNPHAEPEYERVGGEWVRKNPHAKAIYYQVSYIMWLGFFIIMLVLAFFSKPAEEKVIYTPRLVIDTTIEKAPADTFR